MASFKRNGQLTVDSEGMRIVQGVLEQLLTAHSSAGIECPDDTLTKTLDVIIAKAKVRG